MIEKLVLYLQYPFVRYALIVGVLIALCSSLLGVTLVLKRFSYLGDGLSHVAFGATAVAAVKSTESSILKYNGNSPSFIFEENPIYNDGRCSLSILNIEISLFFSPFNSSRLFHLKLE